MAKELKYEDIKEQLEFKSLAHDVEVKEVGENDSLRIKFYALAFGNVDSWDDIIAEKACDEFLNSEEADRMALCYQHDWGKVIGRITSKGVDSYGMWCEAEVLPTSVGKDVIVLIRGGALKEFSIGYRALDYHYETRGEKQVRILDKIHIYEASPVTIAANPKAVLTDAKGAANDNNNNNPKTDNMTEQEIKALQDDLAKAKSSQETMAAELKAAKEATESQKTQIANLDATAKAQQKTIDELKEKMEKSDAPMDIKAFMRNFIESNKEAIEKKMNQEGGRIKLETKSIVDITTALVNPNLSISLQKDTDISAARRKKNTFIELLGVATRTADKLSWIEGSAQDDVDYVDENALNSHKGDATIGEVQRSYGKLQTSLVISTEVSDWYSMLLDWAQNEATAALLAKFNTEILSGAGADTSAATKKKVYGIAGHSTAFSAIDTVKGANVADVIFNMCEQISNEGYNADVAVVSPATYFALRNLKDKNDNYIMDRQNDTLVSDSRVVRVVKGPEMAGKAIVAMDLACVQPYAGNSFEFEAVRDADYDRWKFFFRLAVQNKIKTADKKGIVYVPDYTAAVTALTPSA